VRMTSPHPPPDRFVILVAGFAFLANLLYGGKIDDFHTVVSSFSTLLRFPLGDFDYERLQTVRCKWAMNVSRRCASIVLSRSLMSPHPLCCVPGPTRPHRPLLHAVCGHHLPGLHERDYRYRDAVLRRGTCVFMRKGASSLVHAPSSDICSCVSCTPQVHHELKYADKWKLSTASFEAHLLQRMS
jgi:hypothetical protein